MSFNKSPGNSDAHSNWRAINLLHYFDITDKARDANISSVNASGCMISVWWGQNFNPGVADSSIHINMGDLLLEITLVVRKGQGSITEKEISRTRRLGWVQRSQERVIICYEGELESISLEQRRGGVLNICVPEWESLY